MTGTPAQKAAQDARNTQETSVEDDEPGEVESAEPVEGAEGESVDGVPAPAPIVVSCPQCAVPADPVDLCCPSCHEDLAALVRLRYAGRIAFNDALGLLRGGRWEAAVVELERAVAAEPGLVAAERLLARLSPAASAPVSTSASPR